MEKQDPIEIIKEEHEQMERELVELETIIQDLDKEINFSNLVHEIKRITEIWNGHENKEENVIFPYLRMRKKLQIPVEKMSFQHQELKPHREAIIKALSEGEGSIKEKLKQDGGIIIEKIRDHINQEDELIYTLDESEQFSEKEVEEINEMLDKINTTN